MRLLIHKDYETACQWAAAYIVSRINDFAPSGAKPFVLGLPTGSSPLGVYRRLIAAFKEGKVSFSEVITFNMDEYLGLSADHPQSYRRFMDGNFFSAIDIRRENTHVPDGMAKDPEAECLAYEEAIKAAGGIELFMGGMGNNGHIAFNEPGSSLNSRTRVQNLSRDTIAANSRFFGGNFEKVPTRALTVGIGTVMDAREVLIIVSGRQKARALQAAVEGGVSQWCPLSCLQMHPKAIIVCDEEAADDLKYGTVRYFKDLENLP
uniref:Glucosamine-6-phosphate deaminase n=1 Tax=uncultured bacterium contig00086 TaxID=1181559 RepID=A0A806KGB5_9BACT|nr:glucosamine-6-phosphate deaminase [uncultured bacterium contig00086]